MSVQRRVHFLRWSVILLMTVSLLAAGIGGVQLYLLRRADQFNVIQQTAPTATQAQVVSNLPVANVLSGQWFDHQGNYSPDFAKQMSGIANKIGVPLPPTQISALDTKLGNRVLIQWSVPLGQDYTGIEIKRDEQVIVTDGLGKQGSYFDTTIINNTKYSYTLRSYNLDATSTKVYSEWSSPVTVIPTDVTPPAAPLVVSVVSDTTDTALLITWQASQSSDVTAYRLYRSTTAGQLGQMLVETTIDVWSARDTNVTPGVSYYYTVTALDQAKNESTKSIMTTQPGHAAPFLTPEKTPNAE